MYFLTIITTALLSASITIAVPASTSETKRATLCSGLESEPQCCALDVLGIADLQCDARTLPLLNFQLYTFSKKEVAD